jgi:hypothetical protein
MRIPSLLARQRRFAGVRRLDPRSRRDAPTANWFASEMSNARGETA